MARFNNGNIYTNEKCIGCGKCVPVCSAFGANVSRYKSSGTRYEVGRRCIECGACVNACAHGARAYRDDADAFFKDLHAGRRISVAIDPAFYITYPDKAAKAISYLRSFSVDNIYDVALGVEISMWMHARYLRTPAKEGERRAVIANYCSAVTRYIQNLRPELLPLIIPVRPSLSALLVYIRKYLKDNTPIAYITPCIAKDGESDTDTDTEYAADYRISFEHFMDAIDDAELDGYPEGTANVPSNGMGDACVTNTGVEALLHSIVSKDLAVINYKGSSPSLIRMYRNMKEASNTELPDVAIVSLCEGGCIYGSGAGNARRDHKQSFTVYKNALKSVYSKLPGGGDADANFAYMEKLFEKLDPADFEYHYKDIYQQRFIVPDHTLDEIYNAMNKNTPQKRSVDCGACGYSTCKQLVVAVANGFASKNDCIHYLNDTLYEKSFKDGILDAYNNTGFYKALSVLLGSASDKKYMVTVANVNRLRDVNGLYGRDAGDKLLEHVVSQYKTVFDPSGIVARLQGSLFAFAGEYSAKGIEMLKKRREFSFNYKGTTHNFTMRFGTIIIDDFWKEMTPEEIVAYAYHASDLDRDRSNNTYVVFEKDMIKRIDLETRITAEMKAAKKNGEYVIYLQPQYSHSDGRLVGAEALARWIKKDGTFIMPGDFVSVFERNGYIKEFDKYIWESAFALVKKWEDEGAPLVPISVNISRYSIIDEHIADTIRELYNKYPINKQHLHFEVTESAYVEDQQVVTGRINELREQGFIIAMDDFGSGYSSLNSLKDIPIDILKLDMGFVRGDKYSERGMCIIKHMIEMAKALGLETIAEGVETKEMADAILEAGCDTIQGYLYARPMPIAEYEKLLG